MAVIKQFTVQPNLLPNLLTESEVQRQVLSYLANAGFLAVRINSGAFMQQGKRFFRSYWIKNNGKSKGFPDVLALRNNKFLLFEVKAGNGGHISEAQKDFSKLAKRYFIEVHFVSDLDQVIKIVEEFHGKRTAG